VRQFDASRAKALTTIRNSWRFFSRTFRGFSSTSRFAVRPRRRTCARTTRVLRRVALHCIGATRRFFNNRICVRVALGCARMCVDVRPESEVTERTQMDEGSVNQRPNAEKDRHLCRDCRDRNGQPGGEAPARWTGFLDNRAFPGLVLDCRDDEVCFEPANPAALGGVDEGSAVRVAKNRAVHPLTNQCRERRGGLGGEGGSASPSLDGSTGVVSVS